MECLGLPLDGLPPESGLEEAVRPTVRPTLLPVCLRSPAVGRPDLEVGLPVLLASLVELPVEEALLAVLADESDLEAAPDLGSPEVD